MQALRGPLWAAFFLFLVHANAFGQTAASPARLDFAADLASVNQLIARSPDDLQLHFTRGMLLGELGRYAEAADEFRWRMLVRDPSLPRPRLELGRVLMLAGNYEGARYHFQQVLASELPDAVRNNVLRFLANIREQLPT